MIFLSVSKKENMDSKEKARNGWSSTTDQVAPQHAASELRTPSTFLLLFSAASLRFSRARRWPAVADAILMGR